VSKVVPEHVGGFDVLSEIGRGGMGTVYLGRRPPDGDLVAIKVMPFEHPALAERLRIEARALTNLRHPNLVSVLEVGEDEGFPFYAMTYCPGGSLAQVVERDGKLPTARVAHVVAVVAGALAAMHDRGLVHGDVKSSNVLLSAEDDLYLADFGIATGTNLAPEFLGGEEGTPASDTFALGVLGYELLTGESPPRDNETFIALALGDGAPDTPPALAELITSCLRTEPEARPSDLNAFAEAVRATTSDDQLDASGVPVGSNGTTIVVEASDMVDAALPGEPDWKAPVDSEPVPNWEVRRRRFRFVPVVSAGVAVALIAGVLVNGGGSTTPTSNITSIGYRLPLARYADGVTVDRTWRLTGAKGTQLTGSVQYTNGGATAVVHQEDEFLPKGIVASADRVNFDQLPASIVLADPVIRFCMTLAPGERATIVYTADVPPDGVSASRLGGWAADWERGVAEDHHAQGTPCEGTTMPWSRPQLDSSKAGPFEPSKTNGDVASGAPVRTTTSVAPTDQPAAGSSVPTTTTSAPSKTSTTTAPGAKPAPTGAPTSTASTSRPTTPPTTGAPTTTKPKPAAPQVSGSRSGRTVTFSWGAVANATSYDVSSSVGPLSTTGTSVSFDVCSAMTASVVAKGPGGSSPPSNTASVAANAAPTASAGTDTFAVASNKTYTGSVQKSTHDTDGLSTITSWVLDSTNAPRSWRWSWNAASGGYSFTAPTNQNDTSFTAQWHAVDVCGARSPTVTLTINAAYN
jgi:serine/threonine-protein kinase